jgi:ribosomal protein S18 acetylase RimI-like enzyme
MTHVTIAADEEIEAVVGLVNSAYRGESSRLGWTTEADFLGGQRTDAETLRAELAAKPGAVMLVLRDAERGPMLGCVRLEPVDDATWYLGMLTIDPRLQDRKLGRSLLELAERFVAARGARRMRMTVIGIRTELLAWYERRGYARTGATVEFPYGDARFGEPRGEDLTLLVFEKAL